MRLVAERNDWYSRYTGALGSAGTANPDLLPPGEEHIALTRMELNSVDGAGTKHKPQHNPLNMHRG